jgi:hypothetical protein
MGVFLGLALVTAVAYVVGPTSLGPWSLAALVVLIVARQVVVTRQRRKRRRRPTRRRRAVSEAPLGPDVEERALHAS